MTADAIHLSVVVPFHNEEASLSSLVEQVVEHTRGIAPVEIILVDDGSTDRSPAVAADLCKAHPEVKMLRFAGNHGKAAALQAGFEAVSGQIVITMDADLQDDPSEIPRFVEKLNEGYDLVSGWKAVRHDPWHKTLPSKLFNGVVRTVFHVPLHDFNCGFKAYRSELLANLHLYGELHRYIPVFAARDGARIAEIAVRHHPRQHGRSKYGAERLLKGFLDLITVFVITRFLKRPLHFFGGFGLLLGSVGAGCLTYLACLWLLGVRPIGTRPLLFYGILGLLAGGQLFSVGILGEMMIRLSGKNDPPAISERIGF